MLENEQEIQILKAENQNLRLLLQDSKKEDKGQIKLIKLKPQLPNLYQQKKPRANTQKIKEEVQLPIKKLQFQQIRWKLNINSNTIKNLLQVFNKTMLLQQKDWTSMEVMSEKRVFKQNRKEIGTSRRLQCNYLEVFIESNRYQMIQVVTLLKHNFDSQQQKKQIVSKNNNDLRIYLEKLKKNQKKTKNKSINLLKGKNYYGLKLIQMKKYTVEREISKFLLPLSLGSLSSNKR